LIRWLRNITLTLVGLLVLLAIAGASYQAIATHTDARHFPEPGRLIDVGGYRLKLNCTGSGSPTVILEGGLGDISIEWMRVQQAIARFSRVCSYDRAGYGGSDPGPMPRTSAQIAKELHTLLQNAGERPPCLLVGHSFGGYNVRVFNGQFPTEVLGMVLVEATQEDQYELLPAAWKAMSADLLKHYRNQAKWSPLLVDLGAARLMLRSQGIREDDYLFLQSKYLKARAGELEEIQISAEQARASGSLGEKPLVVLTGENQDAMLGRNLSRRDLDDFQRVWTGDLQLRLARLSTRGKRVMVSGSGHNVPLDRPDAIVQAVQEVRAAAIGPP
jgi:pimeloyl-ACP methyl ester carboxylesterase